MRIEVDTRFEDGQPVTTLVGTVACINRIKVTYSKVRGFRVIYGFSNSFLFAREEHLKPVETHKPRAKDITTIYDSEVGFTTWCLGDISVVFVSNFNVYKIVGPGPAESFRDLDEALMRMMDLRGGMG